MSHLIVGRLRYCLGAGPLRLQAIFACCLDTLVAAGLASLVRGMTTQVNLAARQSADQQACKPRRYYCIQATGKNCLQAQRACRKARICEPTYYEVAQTLYSAPP